MSPFYFRCAACRHKLSAPPEMHGAMIHCPHCDSAMEVPRPHKADSKSVKEEEVASEAPVDFAAGRVPIDSEMDMTPMVDVTFLLLIFFMVTAAFTMQKSFQIPTPKKDEASTNTKTIQDFEDDPEIVVVRVDEFSTFYVSAADWGEEREAPSEQELLVNLREAREGGGATQLLVMAHGDASHEKVVMAMDAGNTVGMEDVKLVTVEDDG